MKRMAAAAVLAVFVHAAVFLLVKHLASGKPVVTAPLPKIVTVTMSYRAPDRSHEKKPEALKKKQVPPKKDKQKKPPPPPKDVINPKPPADLQQDSPVDEKPAKKDPPKKEIGKKDNAPDDTVEDDLKSSTHGNSMSNMTAKIEAVPLYNSNPPPKYPRVAVKRGYQGTAELMVLVNKNGAVDDVWLFESSGYAILDEAALQSVKNWSFTPGKQGDRAIDMWVRVPVRFQLQ